MEYMKVMSMEAFQVINNLIKSHGYERGIYPPSVLEAVKAFDHNLWYHLDKHQTAMTDLRNYFLTAYSEPYMKEKNG